MTRFDVRQVQECTPEEVVGHHDVLVLQRHSGDWYAGSCKMSEGVLVLALANVNEGASSSLVLA